MERRGDRPLRIGERILVSYRSDDVWHERLLTRGLAEMSWLIVTLDGDLYTEKVINCDGEAGLLNMRRLVPGRGTGAARDIPPGCVRVHRFATVPDEDVLRETGRMAVEQGLVLLPGATIGFEEFMAGGTHNSADRVRDREATVRRQVTNKFGSVLPEASVREREGVPWEQTVLLDEYEGLLSDDLAVREAGVAPLTCDWVFAESFRTADGSLLYDVGDVLQEAFSWVIERSSTWNRE